MDKRQKINGNTYRKTADTVEVISMDPCFQCGIVTQPPDKCYRSNVGMGNVGMSIVGMGNVPTARLLCIYCYVNELFNL